jgi:hypothetical protein
MSSLQIEMKHAVQAFVARVVELAHRVAMDTLAASTNHVGRHAGVGSALGASLRIGSGRRRGNRRPKRTPADLDAMSEKFSAFVKAHPGLRIEQINKQLGTTTRDLALPIRKLISADVIAVRGQRRSTTYFASKKAAKA